MLISNYITPVMYSDISGYIPQILESILEVVRGGFTAIPLVAAVGGVIPLLGLIGTGVVIGTIVSFAYYAITLNKVADIRRNYSRAKFESSISDFERAKACVDQTVRFKVYDQAYVSTRGINVIKAGLYLLAQKTKVLSLIGSDLSPAAALLPDINIDTDANAFVYSDQFSGLNDNEQLKLYYYYIERYEYWSEHYDD